jgi:hypothetical protein
MVVENDVSTLKDVTRVPKVQRRFAKYMVVAKDVCILVLVDVTRVLWV